MNLTYDWPMISVTLSITAILAVLSVCYGIQIDIILRYVACIVMCCFAGKLFVKIGD